MILHKGFDGLQDACEAIGAVVVAELELFEVEGEVGDGHAVEFGQALFGEGPEPLDAVEVDAAVGEAGCLVDAFVAEAIGHEPVVAFELVGVDEASAFDLGHQKRAEFRSPHRGDHLHVHLATAFQDAEDWGLARSAMGCRWMDMPKEYGSHKTVWRRLKEWQERGVWEGLWRRLLELGYQAGRLRLGAVAVDATTIEARKGGRQ
jgi:transposase